MKPVIIAFDPGKNGGISVGSESSDLFVIPMLMAGNELDTAAIKDLIKDRKPEKAIVEKVGAMPGQGVVSTFNFGCNYGKLLGLLSGLSVPTELVTPQRWKGVVLDGTPKDKDAAIAYCRRVFPEISLIATPRSRNPHDGIADVICIWEFGRRTYFQGIA